MKTWSQRWNDDRVRPTAKTRYQRGFGGHWQVIRVFITVPLGRAVRQRAAIFAGVNRRLSRPFFNWPDYRRHWRWCCLGAANGSVVAWLAFSASAVKPLFSGACQRPTLGLDEKDVLAKTWFFFGGKNCGDGKGMAEMAAAVVVTSATVAVLNLLQALKVINL